MSMICTTVKVLSESSMYLRCDACLRGCHIELMSCTITMLNYSLLIMLKYARHCSLLQAACDTAFKCLLQSSTCSSSFPLSSRCYKRCQTSVPRHTRMSAFSGCNKPQQSLAYHLVSANVLNLLLAIDDRAVHAHGLIHKAHATREVEAIFCPMVDAFRLFWWRELKHPWLLVYSQRGK